MKKISTKLNISMLIVIFFILAFTFGALVINMSLDYHRQFEKSAEIVLDTRKLKENAKSEQTLDAYLKSKMPLFEQSTNYYILKEGNIVKSSASGGSLKLTSTLSSLIGGEGEGTALDRGVKLEGGYAVYITDSKKELYRSIGDISFLFIQAMLFAVILAVAVSFFVSKRLTQSIGRLEKGAKRMSQGDFEPIEVKGQDEIANLCKVFNDMAGTIKQDYDEFERVEKARREFVANVSHELKTPLTVIKSYSETLASVETDREMTKQFTEVIGCEVDRMSGIVNQLMVLSKLETPLDMPKTSVDVESLCKEIAKSLEIEAKKKELLFDISGKCKVLTSADTVKTIITNLLSNAVKYSKNQSTVEIKLRDGKVSVKNYGTGISDKDLPRIFERFYRTDPARNRETGGTGLGLAIAKESADKIGAKLYATSIPDQYTEFTLEF